MSVTRISLFGAVVLLPILAVKSLLFFTACGAGGGGAEVCSAAFEAARAPHSPEQDSPVLQQIRENAACPSLLEGPVRGLACLHCTQPEAREQALVLHRLLRQSCLRRVKVNYLVDGTFAFDADFLINQLSELASGGRQPHVTFFLANGAAQRRFDVTRIESFATKISPQEFRARIESDTALRDEYQAIVRRLLPVIEHGVSLGAEVALIPYLEDNLTNRAFDVMLALTQAVVPAGLPLRYGRNPCGVDCYPGNEAGIPPGVFEEQHTATAPILIANGIVTNDGLEYTSMATAPNAGARTCLEQLRTVRDLAAELNNSFVLWSARRQGLPANIASTLFPLPAERHYDMPTEAEQVEIISFLREGLE